MEIVFSQVHKIPETFGSPTEYKNSFILPLLEETHSDLSSNLIGLSRAPFCQLLRVERGKNFKPPKALYYRIWLKSTTIDQVGEDHVRRYEPEPGDLIVFTDFRPKRVEDLNSPRSQYKYHIAYVNGPKNERTGEISVLSSKYMKMGNDEQKLYAVYLMNLTTNIRIWKALNSKLEGERLNIIRKVLRPDLKVRITISFVLNELILYLILHNEMTNAYRWESKCEL